MHEVLERYECDMLTRMGHEVYSHGAYARPHGDQDRMRTGIPDMPYDPHWVELCTRYGKENLHPEMIEPFDVIIVMHEPSFIIDNWTKIHHKRVIWRSIGQSVAGVEERLWPYRDMGLEIVRYSPQEALIPNYIGADAIIRFGIDPDEFKGWTGGADMFLNFTQSMKSRGSHCGWSTINRLWDMNIPVALFGAGNSYTDSEKYGANIRGYVPFETQKRVLREAPAYMYFGTHPASYTLNFMEAWMTGIPIVAVGPTIGSPRNSGYAQDTYEIPFLIENGISGFYSDNVIELADMLTALKDDPVMASEMSIAGRAAAIETFGLDTISAQWKAFLER